MEILLALRQPLFPPDTGGKVRSFNIFSRLAKRVAIDAVSFADPAADAPGIAEMRRTFRSYTPVPWKEEAKGSLRFYCGVLASQFRSQPYTLAKCNRAAYRAAVERLAARKSYDLVLCDFLHTAVPLLSMKARPRVVFEHNVEFLLRKRQWELERNPLRRWILENEWRRVRQFEGRVCRVFDHVICVSPEDRASLRGEFGLGPISVLPAGVDADYFSPSLCRRVPGKLVFVGSMDWAPNEDGMAWFLREIYPGIRRAVPHASLDIVGRHPSRRLRAIAGAFPGARVLGAVPDVRPYLSAAEVVVVPLRSGGGTRLKIPEAMAMAKPVVTTSVGAEGLPLRDGSDLCIADGREEFTRSLLALLGDGGLRQFIATAARKAAVERFGWDQVVDRMEDILARVCWKYVPAALPQWGAEDPRVNA